MCRKTQETNKNTAGMSNIYNSSIWRTKKEENAVCPMVGKDFLCHIIIIFRRGWFIMSNCRDHSPKQPPPEAMTTPERV